MLCSYSSRNIFYPLTTMKKTPGTNGYIDVLRDNCLHSQKKVFYFFYLLTSSSFLFFKYRNQLFEHIQSAKIMTYFILKYILSIYRILK